MYGKWEQDGNTHTCDFSSENESIQGRIVRDTRRSMFQWEVIVDGVSIVTGNEEPTLMEAKAHVKMFLVGLGKT